MRTEQDLQVALRERYRRCLTQGFETLSHETALLRAWLAKQPQLVALVEEAATIEPELDVSSWMNSFHGFGFSWPSKTEAGRATLAWAIINAVADDPQGQQGVLKFGHGLSSSNNLNDAARELVERIYQPFFDYLIDHVAAGSSVLYTLDRFVRYVEWFIRGELYNAYEADTANGEMVYDQALRRFLFREGINMPYSQARSASGLSDVLTDLDSEDPLVCEVKLFTGDKRGIAGGVHQAVLYAQDYGKHSAYLMIMNLAGRPLNLPSDVRTTHLATSTSPGCASTSYPCAASHLRPQQARQGGPSRYSSPAHPLSTRTANDEVRSRSRAPLAERTLIGRSGRFEVPITRPPHPASTPDRRGARSARNGLGDIKASVFELMFRRAQDRHRRECPA